MCIRDRYSDIALSTPVMGQNGSTTAVVTVTTVSYTHLDVYKRQGLVIPDNPDKWYVSIGDAATATNGSTQWERSTVSVLARRCV